MRRQRKHPIGRGRIARLDPSRTLTLRRQFQADLRRRFAKLRRAIMELIVTEDALGLKRRRQLVFHAQEEEGKWITLDNGVHVFIDDRGNISKGPEHLTGKNINEIGKPETLPAEPGSTPIKPGYIRLYHQTRQENLDSIRKEGLLYKYAKGLEGPRTVYASETPFYGNAKNTPTIEFQVKEEDFWGTQVKRDVLPEDIIAIHEPWHRHARYAENDPDVLRETLEGKNDRLLDDPEYGPAVKYIKKKYDKPQTNAESEPGSWITVKGNHIFIPDGVDKGEAIKRHFEEKEKSKAKQTTTVKQTSTPEFKRWFGDSKVVDEDGEPLVVYHGTSADFTEFSPRRSDRPDIWFTSSPEFAGVYAGLTGESGGNIKPVYLSMKNPVYGEPGNPVTIPEAIRTGHDGFIYKDLADKEKKAKTFIVLSPTQIKSAIGNQGTFDPKDPIITHAEGRWQFHATDQKLTAFQQWLRQRIAMYLIQDQIDENAWWNRYIMEGFKKGAGRAFDDTRPQVREWQNTPEARQRLDFYNGTREEFLRSSFNWPTSREKIKLLASRTYTDLKGVTEGMAARISHSLVDGLTKGDSPRTIARQLSKDVDISRGRAETIARTEIIRTHAEGQLDAFEKLGVTAVGVMAEWSTAEDDRVCPLCQPLDGMVMKVQEARGLLPRHPNCRCAWVPASVGEDEKKQKRSKSAIELAIEKSYEAELPSTSKRTIAEQKKLSQWGGTDKMISKKRPQSVLKKKPVQG